MKSIFKTVFFSLFFLYSCNSSSTKDIITVAEEIVIDAKHQTALSLDSIIKTVEFIKLETTDSCIVGAISQLIFTDSLIIIADNKSMTINVFDKTGKFKHQIGKIGHGPGEYVDITNLCIEPLKNNLAIFDNNQNKVLYYTLDGRYDYSEKTQFMLDYFEYLQNGYKAYYKGGMKDPKLGKFKSNPLIVTDNRNSVLYGECVDYYELNKFEYTMVRPLRKFNNEVYFSPNFSNDIYLVTDSLLIPKYHINIAWNGMPPLDNQITNEQFREYCKRYYIFNGDIVELRDLTYINIMTPTGYPFVVYSHSNQKTFFSTDQGSHPLFPFLKGQAPKARYGDNTVVFDVPAYSLMMNKEEWYKHEKDRQFLDDLYGGLTEESNPVLVLCHLNEKIGYEK